MSLPVRGAWIEIATSRVMNSSLVMSLPVRGAWIEISAYQTNTADGVLSLPVRGAWIEIGENRFDGFAANVAPRAGSVD